jgi:Fe-Mn family superoxide dismutase
MVEKIPFTYSKDITVVNQAQYEAHLRLYDGYINSLNKIDSILTQGDAQREQANATFSWYRELKRGETYALDGIILHELYFENIGGNEASLESGPMDMLEQAFGGFDLWKEDFIATAKVSRGWAVLCYDQRSMRLRNISLDSHDLGNIAYSAPILVLDMYEHAYFLQYADKKAEYIDNFMKNINWAVVGSRARF